MFSALFTKAKSFFSNSQKVFLAFFLNQNLKPYLKESIQQADLEFQLGTGDVQLKDLVLCEHTINKLLSGVGFRVSDGFIRDLSATIPWNNIKKDTVKIKLSGLALNLCSSTDARTEESGGEEETDESLESSFIASVNDSILLNKTIAPSALFEPDNSNSNSSSGNNSANSGSPLFMISLIEELFKRIFATLEITLRDTTITLTHKNFELRVIVDFMHYENPDSETLELTATSRRKITFRDLVVEARYHKSESEREAHTDWFKVVAYTGEDNIEIQFGSVEEEDSDSVKDIQITTELTSSELELTVSPPVLRSLIDLSSSFAFRSLDESRSDCSSGNGDDGRDDVQDPLASSVLLRYSPQCANPQLSLKARTGLEVSLKVSEGRVQIMSFDSHQTTTQSLSNSFADLSSILLFSFSHLNLSLQQHPCFLAEVSVASCLFMTADQTPDIPLFEIANNKGRDTRQPIKLSVTNTSGGQSAQSIVTLQSLPPITMRYPSHKTLVYLTSLSHAFLENGETSNVAKEVKNKTESDSMGIASTIVRFSIPLQIVLRDIPIGAKKSRITLSFHRLFVEASSAENISSYAMHFESLDFSFFNVNSEKAIFSASVENGDRSVIDENESLEPCIKFLKKRVEKSFTTSSYSPSSNHPFVEASFFADNQNRINTGHREHYEIEVNISSIGLCLLDEANIQEIMAFASTLWTPDTDGSKSMLTLDEIPLSSHNLRTQILRISFRISSTDKKTNLLEEMKFSANKITASLVSNFLTAQKQTYRAWINYQSMELLHEKQDKAARHEQRLLCSPSPPLYHYVGEQRDSRDKDHILWAQLKSLSYKRREDPVSVVFQTPLRLCFHHHALSYISRLVDSWFPSNIQEDIGKTKENTIDLIEKWLPSSAQLEVTDASICYTPSLPLPATKTTRIPCARICLGQIKVNGVSGISYEKDRQSMAKVHKVVTVPTVENIAFYMGFTANSTIFDEKLIMSLDSLELSSIVYPSTSVTCTLKSKLEITLRADSLFTLSHRIGSRISSDLNDLLFGSNSSGTISQPFQVAKEEEVEEDSAKEADEVREDEAIASWIMVGEKEELPIAKVVDNVNFVIKEDYVDNPVVNEQKLSRSNRSVPSEVIIIQKAEFCIRLLGGYDWQTSDQLLYDTINKAVEEKESGEDEDFEPICVDINEQKLFDYYKRHINDSVELLGCIDRITMEIFTDFFINWRLSIALSSFTAKDMVKASHWRTLLQIKNDEKKELCKVILENARLKHQHPLSIHRSSAFQFKLSVAPVRLYVDQDTLDFLANFFTWTELTTDASINPTTSSTTPLLFQDVRIEEIKLEVDYKPKRLDYPSIRIGSSVWILKMIPLERTKLKLKSMVLLKTRTLEEVVDRVTDTWIPNIKQTQVHKYLSGVQPIQIIFKIGDSLVGLVRLPIEQYHQDGRIFYGIQVGVQSLIKTVTVELLTLGSRASIATQKLLINTERAITGEKSTQSEPSKYAEQPGSLSEGFQKATQHVTSEISSAWQNVNPEAPYQGIPSLVLRSLASVSQAISQMALGARNSVEPIEKELADEKYKRKGERPSLFVSSSSSESLSSTSPPPVVERTSVRQQNTNGNSNNQETPPPPPRRGSRSKK